MNSIIWLIIAALIIIIGLIFFAFSSNLKSKNNSFNSEYLKIDLQKKSNQISVVHLKILLFSRIVDFLRSRSGLKDNDIDNIAFSLQEKISNEGYQTVYGIFNKRTCQVIDAERVSSEEIDDELKNIHANKELAIYN